MVVAIAFLLVLSSHLPELCIAVLLLFPHFCTDCRVVLDILQLLILATSIACPLMLLPCRVHDFQDVRNPFTLFYGLVIRRMIGLA